MTSYQRELHISPLENCVEELLWRSALGPLGWVDSIVYTISSAEHYWLPSPQLTVAFTVCSVLFLWAVLILRHYISRQSSLGLYNCMSFYLWFPEFDANRTVDSSATESCVVGFYHPAWCAHSDGLSVSRNNWFLSMPLVRVFLAILLYSDWARLLSYLP